MFYSRLAATACAVLLSSHAPLAETAVMQSGTDRFVAGDSVTETGQTAGDSFVAGQSVMARGAVGGDLHVFGMDVSVRGAIGADLYAMGGTVVLRGPTGQDLTAAGMTVRTEATANTGGNVRLLGRTLTIEGPVAGALLAAGQDVTLNAPVSGDARLFGQTFHFGPDAQVSGTLTYVAEQPVTVPQSVAPAERIVFQKAEGFEIWEEFAKSTEMHGMPGRPGIGTILFGVIVSLLFFVTLGALALGFMPVRLENMRAETEKELGWSILLGVAGLSFLFGLVPITGMTIVGLPFVPVVVLAILATWIFGYALGIYVTAMRVWAGFGGGPHLGNAQRLLVFTAAIIAVAILNFIPFVGWVINFTLVLLGAGAMTRSVIAALRGRFGGAGDTGDTHRGSPPETPVS